MKPKKKVVTASDVRAGRSGTGAAKGPGKPKRTPTVRTIRSAIVPVDRSRGPTGGRARIEAGRAVADLGALPPIRPTLAEQEALDRIDLSVDLAPKRGFPLANPILVASGTFGYGVEYGEVVDVERLGAICCKGTTLKPRAGNPPPRVIETPGGMLNSIGLQNPGVDAVIEKYGPVWGGWKVPVIVNVAGESI